LLAFNRLFVVLELFVALVSDAFLIRFSRGLEVGLSVVEVKSTSEYRIDESEYLKTVAGVDE
jgi:hypothetical protein